MKAAFAALILLPSFVFAEVVPAPPPEPAPLEVPANYPAPVRRELRDYLRSERRQQDELAAGKAFLGAEFLFVTNSYLASLAPKIYGGAGLILFPAGVLQSPPSAERNTAIVLMEGLAAYNLFGVDDDEMSEGEIFRENLLAWHGILVARALVRHVSAKRKEKAAQLTLVPLRDGAAVTWAGRF